MAGQPNSAKRIGFDRGTHAVPANSEAPSTGYSKYGGSVPKAVSNEATPERPQTSRLPVDAFELPPDASPPCREHDALERHLGGRGGAEPDPEPIVADCFDTRRVQDKARARFYRIRVCRIVLAEPRLDPVAAAKRGEADVGAAVSRGVGRT